MRNYSLNDNNKFSLAMLLMTLVIIFGTGHFGVEGMNASVFAVDYGEGFNARGLLGSILNFVCWIFGDKCYCYSTVFIISTFFYVLYLFVLWRVAKKMINTLNKDGYAKAYIMAISPIFITMFLSVDNYGRPDMLLMTLSLIAGYSIIKGRCLFLSLLCPSIAMITHEGYIFTFYNLVIACFIYKIAVSKGNARRINIIWLVLSLLTVLGLFIWLFFLSRSLSPVSQQYYDSVIQRAELLKSNTKGAYVHYNFLDATILGKDLYEDELEYTKEAFLHLTLFLMMLSPLLIVVVRFVKKLFFRTKLKKTMIVLCLGSLSLVPEFILKCDYGRWVFAIFAYYTLLVALLIVSGNNVIKNVFLETMQNLSENKWFAIFLAMYMMVFLPLQTYQVSTLNAGLGKNMLQFISGGIV